MAVKYLDNVMVDIDPKMLERFKNYSIEFSYIKPHNRVDFEAALTNFLINKKIQNERQLEQELNELFPDEQHALYFVDMGKMDVSLNMKSFGLLEKTSEYLKLEEKENEEADKLKEEFLVRCVDTSLNPSKKLKAALTESGQKLIKSMNNKVCGFSNGVRLKLGTAEF